MSPIETLILNILEEKLTEHEGKGNPKLKEILEAVQAQGKDIAQMKADVQFVKGQFPGGGDVPGMTQEQMDALGERLKADTDKVNEFDATVQPGS
jgi:hypothetical protein